MEPIQEVRTVTPSERPVVSLSAIDTEHFGVRVARTSHLTLDTLPDINCFCEKEAVVLLIARCSVAQLELLQNLLRAGFELMDTLVYYVHDLARIPQRITREDVHVRSIVPGEENQVKALAADIFRGYQGHYQADKKLNPFQCEQIYQSWAYRACMFRDVADEVLVADVDGCLQGFITLKMNSSTEAEGGLFGVSTPVRGSGIAPALMCRALDWCRAKDLEKMVISTQIHNIASQKVWVRVGFEPSHAFYTLHKWYDPNPGVPSPS